MDESARTPTSALVGILAIAAPVLMGGSFLLLSLGFDYPNVMDQAVGDVLADAADAGAEVPVFWAGAMAGAVALLLLAVGLPGTVGGARPPVLSMVSASGALAALFMILDLSQWVWMIPEMADRWVAGDAAQRSSIEADWEAFHQYVGEGIGRFLATYMSGLWAIGVGLLQVRSRFGRPIVGAAGVASGVAFLASAVPGLPFSVWSALNSLGFVVWFVWLLATGALLLNVPLAVRLLR